MLQKPSNRICSNHGKEMLFCKKGKVNGVKSIVYEKDGKVIAYKTVEDFLKDLMTDSYPEYTFSER